MSGGRGVVTSSSFGGGLILRCVTPCLLSYCGAWWEGCGELVVVWWLAGSGARCDTVLVVIRW